MLILAGLRWPRLTSAAQSVRAGLCCLKFVPALLLFMIAMLYGNLSMAQNHSLPVIELHSGQHKIYAELANTEPSRNRGLMFRTKLAKNSGMLFVFDQPQMPCFWMKNTPLPLTIAFIDKNGVIVNLYDMQPYSIDHHCPTKPIVYALEMEQGWFSANNVTVGSKMQGLPH